MTKIPDELRDLLSGGHNVWVATVSPDGTPNVSIKGSGALLDDEHLYFADMFSRKTRENLEHDNRVAVGIHDPDRRLAMQVKGHAELIDHGEVFDRVNEKLRPISGGLAPSTADAALPTQLGRAKATSTAGRLVGVEAPEARSRVARSQWRQSRAANLGSSSTRYRCRSLSPGRSWRASGANLTQSSGECAVVAAAFAWSAPGTGDGGVGDGGIRIQPLPLWSATRRTRLVVSETRSRSSCRTGFVVLWRSGARTAADVGISSGQMSLPCGLASPRKEGL
jgi:uncharacterized protein